MSIKWCEELSKKSVLKVPRMVNLLVGRVGAGLERPLSGVKGYQRSQC